MAWRIVKQPNGKYALWSDSVDNFTVVDMTRDEAVDECLNDLGRKDAPVKVQRADDNPGRWDECLATIKNVHGQKEYEKIKAMNWI